MDSARGGPLSETGAARWRRKNVVGRLRFQTVVAVALGVFARPIIRPFVRRRSMGNPSSLAPVQIEGEQIDAGRTRSLCGSVVRPATSRFCPALNSRVVCPNSLEA